MKNYKRVQLGDAEMYNKILDPEEESTLSTIAIATVMILSILVIAAELTGFTDYFISLWK
jgi:hypothetical protein